MSLTEADILAMSALEFHNFKRGLSGLPPVAALSPPGPVFPDSSPLLSSRFQSERNAPLGCGSHC